MREWWEFSENFKLCDDCRKRYREKSRKLYEENPDLCKLKQKQYRDTHKEQEKSRHKKYQEDNKEKIEAHRKEYMKIIYHCPFCNYDVKHYKKSQHEKSKMHQNNVILKELEDLKKININLNDIENNEVKNYIKSSS